MISEKYTHCSTTSQLPAPQFLRRLPDIHKERCLRSLIKAKIHDQTTLHYPSQTESEKKTKNKKYNLIFKLEKNANLDSELAAVDPHHKNTIFTMNVLFTTNHK